MRRTGGRRIVVLTGAGISAESGLGTFRGPAADAMWARVDPMQLATPEAFARDPDAVHAFYNARRRNLLTARPNAAHEALARLEAGLAARGTRWSWSPRTSTTCTSAPAAPACCTCTANC